MPAAGRDAGGRRPVPRVGERERSGLHRGELDAQARADHDETEHDPDGPEDELADGHAQHATRDREEPEAPHDEVTQAVRHAPAQHRRGRATHHQRGDRRRGREARRPGGDQRQPDQQQRQHHVVQCAEGRGDHHRAVGPRRSGSRSATADGSDRYLGEIAAAARQRQDGRGQDREGCEHDEHRPPSQPSDEQGAHHRADAGGHVAQPGQQSEPPAGPARHRRELGVHDGEHDGHPEGLHGPRAQQATQARCRPGRQRSHRQHREAAAQRTRVSEPVGQRPGDGLSEELDPEERGDDPDHGSGRAPQVDRDVRQGDGQHRGAEHRETGRGHQRAHHPRCRGRSDRPFPWLATCGRGRPTSSAASLLHAAPSDHPGHDVAADGRRHP
jgi:hypothetical protein